MPPEGKGILANLVATQEDLSAAWSEAIAIALRNHKRAGVPVATWDDTNDRVLLISPEELSLSPEESLEAMASKTSN